MAYTSNFCPSSHISPLELLQPCNTDHGQHPLTLLCEHMLGFVVTDPDTMTLKEALGQDNRFQFLEAIRKELNDYISHRYWTIIHRKTVPVHKTCIPMVWSMKRKRNHVGAGSSNPGAKIYTCAP